MNEPIAGVEPAAEDLRRLLAKGVPPLPEPPDRVGAVGARVRRTRMRHAVAAGVAVAVLAVLAVSVPRLVTDRAIEPTPASSLGPDGCPLPGTTPERYYTGQPDRFQLPAGPSRITLCELVTAPGLALRRDPHAGQPRVLTTDVATMVDVLNALPDLGTALGDTPAEQFGGCPSIAYPTELSFVLSYPDRPPVVVWLDRACMVAVYAGRSRYDLRTALTAFFGRYRQQLVTTVQRSALTGPPCADTLPASTVDPTTLQSQVIRNEIGRTREELDPLLPSPLAAVTACRYGVTPDGARLTVDGRVDNAVLPAVRAQLNAVVQEVTTWTECGAGADLPAVLDLFHVVDRTGAVTDIRVIRRPCVGADVADRWGFDLPHDLLALLDTGVGPPR